MYCSQGESANAVEETAKGDFPIHTKSRMVASNFSAK